MKKTVTCRSCGKQFVSKSGTPEAYCSPECRKEGRNRLERIRRQLKRDTDEDFGKKRAQALIDKKFKRSVKTLDDWCREAVECNLDYGNYRALIERGKTFEELKTQYELRRQTP